MSSTSDYCRLSDFYCVYCGRVLHSRVIVINALYPELATNYCGRRECAAKDPSAFLPRLIRWPDSMDEEPERLPLPGIYPTSVRLMTP